VYFVLLAAAVAILAGVVVVAMGRGGEMAQCHRDAPMRPPRIRTAADLAMLRLPVGLFGYQEEATNAALDAATRLIAEQQAEIARLRADAWRLRPQRDADADPRTAGGTQQGAAEAGAAQSPPDTGSPAAETGVLPSPDPVGGQM
jgi:hypothetical protein